MFNIRKKYILGGLLGKKWRTEETSAKAEPINRLAPSTSLEKEDMKLLMLHSEGGGQKKDGS